MIQRYSQSLFLVPLKGGRWHIIPQLAVYTRPLIYHLYIAFWGVKNATYHPLQEPEKSIDIHIPSL